MKVHQAFIYELNPNKTQVDLFESSCRASRFAYNWGLNIYKARIEEKGKWPGKLGLHILWMEQRSTIAPWFNEYSSKIYESAFANLDQTFKNWVRERKRNPNYGFPKYRNRFKHNSFRMQTQSKVITNGSAILIPRMGWIKTKEPTVKFKGRPLSITISKDVKRWNAAIGVEYEAPSVPLKEGQIVGIDLGLKSYAILSNGLYYNGPKASIVNERKLQHKSRMHSKKQKGSSNRKKSQFYLANQHRKIRNMRKDFINKLTTELSESYAVIGMEDLNVKGMVKNHKMARSISDASWSEFLRVLTYKCKKTGCRLIIIDRFFPSSQLCSRCGVVNKEMKDLKIRTFECPDCGLQIDRDLNAALNIEAETRRILKEEPSHEHPTD